MKQTRVLLFIAVILLEMYVGTAFGQSGSNVPEANGKTSGQRQVIKIGSVDYAFRWCAPGTFLMGADPSDTASFPDEIQHQVTLTQGFWILETEVTQKMYTDIVGDNPSAFSREKFYKPGIVMQELDSWPVESVTWYDAVSFCRKLTKRLAAAGYEFRLPTEAQWEYACRAGSRGAFSGPLEKTGWTRVDSHSPAKVGTKKPNAWGIYDMHGNVFEWCQDWVGPYSSEPVSDPSGPTDGQYKMIRGGAWHHMPRYARSSFRYDIYFPDSIHSGLGFRVIMIAR